MKKLLLFPYHPDIDLFVEYALSLKQTQIVGVCSFKEDAAAVKVLNEKLGGTGDFDEMLEACDRVLLLENYRRFRTEKYYEIMEKTMAAGREVMVVPQLEQELELNPYKGRYTILQNMPNLDVPELEKLKYLERKRYQIEAPVIGVFGLGKNCGKFENQLRLKNVLDREGYDVVWISSNPLGALFGGCTMPNFLYDEERSFEEKVFAFNEFLYRINFVKKPDLFVVGVPEGISEFDRYEYHHFAEYPLVIGSAASVDGAVLCTYFLKAPYPEGIKKLMDHSREKYGFPTDVVSVGKTTYETIEGIREMTYSFLNGDYVKKYFLPEEKLPDFIVGVWERERLEKAVKNMLERLQSNADAI